MLVMGEHQSRGKRFDGRNKPLETFFFEFNRKCFSRVGKVEACDVTVAGNQNCLVTTQHLGGMISKFSYRGKNQLRVVHKFYTGCNGVQLI